MYFLYAGISVPAISSREGTSSILYLLAIFASLNIINPLGLLAPPY
ncbi:hypothetical protein FORC066_1512 [Yersinia enterocolitica]|nr:hypothetical protein FORC066_1512 [Yersinia enterocolitica]